MILTRINKTFKSFSFMKSYLFGLLVILAFGITACAGDAPKGEEVKSQDAVETKEAPAEVVGYLIDVDKSTISWEATKKISGGHAGNFKIAKGMLGVTNNQVASGAFVIDINSMTCTDIEDPKENEDFIGHLKSPDFFNTAEHGYANFDITSITPAATPSETVSHEITGNLKLMGVSRSITIPALVNVTANQVTASTPVFHIDRTEWGIKYGSGSIAGIAQDRIINDNVNMSISLTANLK